MSSISLISHYSSETSLSTIEVGPDLFSCHPSSREPEKTSNHETPRESGASIDNQPKHHPTISGSYHQCPNSKNGGAKKWTGQRGKPSNQTNHKAGQTEPGGIPTSGNVKSRAENVAQISIRIARRGAKNNCPEDATEHADSGTSTGKSQSVQQAMWNERAAPDRIKLPRRCIWILFDVHNCTVPRLTYSRARAT